MYQSMTGDVIKMMPYLYDMIRVLSSAVEHRVTSTARRGLSRPSRDMSNCGKIIKHSTICDNLFYMPTRLYIYRHIRI